MSMLDWDNELASIAAEAQGLLASQRESRKEQRRALVALKVDAVQAQLKLENALERLKRFAQKDLLLLPREKAVLHFGRIYCERAAAHMDVLGKVLTKNLWLKLVTLRSGDVLDGDELVGLSVRQANLGKTERYLKGALAAVKKQQTELVATYHALAVEKQNREAAACMAARLGGGDPISGALAAYFMRLTAAARGDAAAKRFFDLHQRYEGKAKTLMGLCRNSVLKAQGPSPKESEKLASAMRQLDELESGVKAAYQEIVQDQAPKARPTLIRKG
jgi:hypothetical protein